jgi:ribosomal protein L16 Arg81 hydroxylase
MPTVIEIEGIFQTTEKAATPHRIPDFAALLAPALPADFFREHWERKPLHLSRGDAHYYDGVLTNHDLESIISSADLRYPAIQLARDGGYVPPETYTKNIQQGREFFNGVPDVAQIQSEYRSGATIVLLALHRTWAPLRELCESLENDLTHLVHANAYLTPENSPGFAPHYDTHEVFVLQVAGSKRWRVFQPPLALPHHTQPFTPKGYVPRPLLELELKQGDLLYLPRGYVHAAHTSQAHSAHVTIGISVYTWVELISELMASSKEIHQFRTALPPGFARREEMKKTLKEVLAVGARRLIDSCDSDRLIDDFLQRIRPARGRQERTFHSDSREIGLQTKLKTPDPRHYRFSTEEHGTILEFAGRKFVFPDKIRVTLDEMCAKESFHPGELAGPLDNSGKLNLVRYLHGERFLTFVD